MQIFGKTSLIPILLLFVAALLNSCALMQQLGRPVNGAHTDRAKRTVSQREAMHSTALLIEASRHKITGNFDQAVVLYYEATQIDPSNDAAFFELAKLHAMQEQTEDALLFASQAVALDPLNVFYQTLLAELYLLSSNPTQAVEVFRLLAQNNPGQPGFRLSLAETLAEAGRVDEAIEVYNQIEAVIGINEDISLRKQRLLIENNRMEEAIKEAETLVRAFPEEPFFAEILGDLYLETGQNAKAKELFDGLLRDDPENPYALLMIADYYHTEGHDSLAISAMKRAFGSERLDKDSRMRMLFTLYHLSGESQVYLEPALTLARNLITLYPDDPEPYLIYGDFLFRENRYDEARRQYLSGAELDPRRLQAWHQLLVTINILQDWQNLLQYSNRALEYFLEQPVLFLFNGLAHFQLENHKEAASALEFGKSLLDPENALLLSFYELLGSAYHHLGDYARSDTAYERALRLDPSNSTILNNYAYHLAVRNTNLQKAEAMALEANRLRPGIPAYMDTLGWVYFRQGRFLEAKEWIGKAVQESETPSAVILEQYGNVLYKLNYIDEAVEYWKKAKETGEGSDLLPLKIRDRKFHENP